jgi:NAD(P)-dependent dehydrogenase (short-subunit alcohol dehydrogenase family)
MELGLRDRACLVTGSTGGIGLATAGMLVAEGARVVTCGRRGAPEVGEELHVVADLGEPGEPARVVRQAAEALGGLDVLVNNVGVARQARFEDVGDDEWEDYWQLNVMSYVRAIRAALPLLRERGGGAIVNLSSSAGKRPSTTMPHYSVTKAAVLSLSRLVADLYAAEGIRCNAVAGTSRPHAQARPARRRLPPWGRGVRWAGSPSRRRSLPSSSSCARTERPTSPGRPGARTAGPSPSSSSEERFVTLSGRPRHVPRHRRR